MRAGRRVELQWLRALAACEVVLCHSDLLTKHFSDAAIARSWYQPFSALGVELFFIVSGYVICMRAGSGEKAGSFLVARIVRLLPMYWLFTSLAVLAYFLNPAWRLNNFGLDLASMAKSYLILPQQGFPILGVGWTLEHEVIFYLAVAAMLATLGAGRAARLGLGWAMVLLGAAGLIHGGPAGPVAGIPPPGAAGALFTHVASPFMLAFAIGWLARALEDEDGSAIVLHLAPMAAILLAAAWLAPAGALLPAWRILAAGAVFAVFLSCRGRLNEDSPPGRLLALLGEASFSLYLSHWFVLSSAGKLLGHARIPQAWDVPVRIAGIALACAIGLALYRTIEKPLDRRLRPGRRALPAMAPAG